MPSLEKAAWYVAAGLAVLPRHYRAAADRCRREGKDPTKIPVKYLWDEKRLDSTIL
jgi:hypothetical protein